MAKIPGSQVRSYPQRLFGKPIERFSAEFLKKALKLENSRGAAFLVRHFYARDANAVK